MVYTPRVSIVHYQGESMKQQQEGNVLLSALKGPRQFYRQMRGGKGLWLYDLITVGGFGLRWVLYRLGALVKRSSAPAAQREGPLQPRPDAPRPAHHARLNGKKPHAHVPPLPAVPVESLIRETLARDQRALRDPARRERLRLLLGGGSGRRGGHRRLDEAGPVRRPDAQCPRGIDGHRPARLFRSG